MKLLYVAPHIYDYGTETHIARAWESIGVEVIKVAEATATPQSIEAAAVEHDVDLVGYTKTFGLPFPEEVIKVWRRLEARGITTFSWHLDLYFGIQRQATVTLDDPFWAVGTVLTADGDDEAQRWFDSIGVRHVWMPPAVDEAEARQPGNWCAAFARDVGFIGGGRSYAHIDQWPWRGELIGALESRYGDKFKRWGGGTQVVRSQWLNDAFASIRCVVGDSFNLLRADGTRKPGYTSDRLCESLGRGAVLAYPRIPGVMEWFGFEDGEHLRLFDYGDIDGVCRVVDELLADPEGARAMAARGRALMLERHTYAHRCRAVLEVLGR